MTAVFADREKFEILDDRGTCGRDCGVVVGC